MKSYKEVFQALADGKEIQTKVRIGDAAQVWQTATALKVCELISTGLDVAGFRIKPETVTINGRKYLNQKRKRLKKVLHITMQV